MQLAEITVQPCGCIAVPEELAALLGMVPGAVLAVGLDEAQRSVTLKVAAGAPLNVALARAACSLKR